MIDVPFDADEYERILEELIQTSKFKKVSSDGIEADISQSFSKA
jgi:hypothetical protein